MMKAPPTAAIQIITKLVFLKIEQKFHSLPTILCFYMAQKIDYDGLDQRSKSNLRSLYVGVYAILPKFYYYKNEVHFLSYQDRRRGP